MENLESQLEELKRKQKKVFFVLGEMLYNLNQNGNVRFLYTSQGVAHEKEVDKTLRLLGYLAERIDKFEGLSSGEVVAEETAERGA